jgi:tRNA pseudouridine55 synthase
MALEQNIFNLYKKLGETPLECLNRYRSTRPELKGAPMTYLGRLDPMAEGVLLVLIGNTTEAERERLLNLTKEYEFECLWGVETDTYDSLGKIIQTRQPAWLTSLENEIEEVAHGCVGKRMQTYPAYSSKTVLGKPLFMWAREGKLDEIEIPKRDVEIFSIDVMSNKSIVVVDLLKEITEKISLVKGDFRQEEILNLWEKTLGGKMDDSFFVTKMKASVSSGTYIRALVHEMGKKLGCGGLAFSIKRTKVGDYLFKDSEI